MEKENILVSACLLGMRCRYNGGHCLCRRLSKLGSKYRLIPVCPEVLGGMSIPRQPSEIVGDRVLFKEGADVTAAFRLGAKRTLAMARKYKARKALLKAHSPSCGSGFVYDGTFSGKLIPGKGFAAELLERKGIIVFSERNMERLLK